ncbi:MAG: response regulator transcription factor [Magnetococcales bacterium]|nr:response regulator transcription factor [Magnetococcales bacterium]
MIRTIQVLLIDSDRLRRDLLRSMLEGVGLEVLGAPVEGLGWRVMRAAPCDLVITDLPLTDAEGLEILRELPSAYPETHIIALMDGIEVQREARELADDRLRDRVRVLLKPVFRGQLLTSIRELFPDWHPEGGTDWHREGV